MTPSFFASKSLLQFIRVGLAVAALALLQACSAIKLAYNNAPEFAFWWLDGYADFQGEQSAKVRDELARLLLWHRTNELPKIADLLQKVQQLAQSDIPPPQVCAVFSDTRERFNAVSRQAETATVQLTMGLKPEQIAHIEAKFAKGNDEYRKDWVRLAAAERLEKRLSANVERAEEFYGKLDDRQVAVLSGALGGSSFDATLGFAERQRRQQDMLQTLKTASAKTNPAEVLALLRAFQDRVYRSPNATYQAYSDKLTQESCNSFSLLHNSTSPEQRRRAVARLGAYERDARELNSQR